MLCDRIGIKAFRVYCKAYLLTVFADCYKVINPVFDIFFVVGLDIFSNTIMLTLSIFTKLKYISKYYKPPVYRLFATTHFPNNLNRSLHRVRACIIGIINYGKPIWLNNVTSA